MARARRRPGRPDRVHDHMPGAGPLPDTIQFGITNVSGDPTQIGLSISDAPLGGNPTITSAETIRLATALLPHADYETARRAVGGTRSRVRKAMPVALVLSALGLGLKGARLFSYLPVIGNYLAADANTVDTLRRAYEVPPGQDVARFVTEQRMFTLAQVRDAVRGGELPGLPEDVRKEAELNRFKAEEYDTACRQLRCEYEPDGNVVVLEPIISSRLAAAEEGRLAAEKRHNEEVQLLTREIQELQMKLYVTGGESGPDELEEKLACAKIDVADAHDQILKLRKELDDQREQWEQKWKATMHIGEPEIYVFDQVERAIDGANVHGIPAQLFRKIQELKADRVKLVELEERLKALEEKGKTLLALNHLVTTGKGPLSATLNITLDGPMLQTVSGSPVDSSELQTTTYFFVLADGSRLAVTVPPYAAYVTKARAVELPKE